MMMLGLWTHNAWRLWNRHQAPLWARQHALLLLALLAAYAINGMFHDVAIISMVNMLLFFVAGVSQGLVPHLQAGRAPGCTPAPTTDRLDHRLSHTAGVTT